MATKMILGGGKVTTVYDDRWAPILAALVGEEYEAPRVTDVERIRGEWVATHRSSGMVIARGPNRAEVIQAEVAWLESRLS